MKKNPYSLTLAMLLAAGTVAQATPTTTYDWSETGSSYGNGSGTLTVDTTSDLGPDSNYYHFTGNGYDYTILSLTGTFDGVALTEDFTGFNFNYLDFSSSTASASDLLNEGISFLAGSTDYLIAEFDADDPSPATTFQGNNSDAGTDVFTLTPVPEPGSLALTALGGVALLGWRKRTAT